MKWWKVGAYASLSGRSASLVFAGGMIWFISSTRCANIDDARMEKAGQVTGMLLGAGIVLIWFYAFSRLKKRSKNGCSKAVVGPHRLAELLGGERVARSDSQAAETFRRSTPSRLASCRG